MKKGQMNRRNFVKTVSALAAFEGIGSKLNAQTPGVTMPLKGIRFDFPRGQRQLFLDDQGIAKIENLARTMHQPLKKGAVIRPDPSRGITSIQIRSAPNWDPEAKLFKFWIMSQPDDLKDGLATSGYYESADGLHWREPALGQIESRGSRNNNFVTVAGLNSRVDCAIYDPLDPDPKSRYKGFTLRALFDLKKDPKAKLQWELQPVVSDGVTWRKLEVPGMDSADEYNVSFDAVEKQFIATVKHSGPHGRSVFLSTSKDFRHWTKHELIFHADDLDQELGRRNIAQHFADPRLRKPYFNMPAKYNVDVYNMGTFRYEGLYIGMPAMYHKTGQVPGSWPGFNDFPNAPGIELYRRFGDWVGFHPIQLVCSRDLRRWTRLGDRKPFLEPSPLGAGAYDLSCLIGPSYPIFRGDELWFYYTGLKSYGGEFDDDGLGRDRSAICLAALRRDGFISLNAGEEEGSVLTEPFLFPEGELHLNVNAPRGRVVVQICDEKATAIPGFEASDEIRGDHTDTLVRWAKGRPQQLSQKKVCLRIRVRQGELYSYWIQ